MGLGSLKPVLDAAMQYGYGQGAFNVNAVAQAKAVIEVHEMFRAPAVLQGADLANGFMGGRTDFANATLEDKKRGAKRIADAVRKYGEHASIPVVLHLDHGRDFDSCKAAIDGGYTSVMIDGSSLSFEENVELTREVVKYAHARGQRRRRAGCPGRCGGSRVRGKLHLYQPAESGGIFQEDGSGRSGHLLWHHARGVQGQGCKTPPSDPPLPSGECMSHEGIHGALVSHGSSTVPKYIVDEINAMGGQLQNAYGISIQELTEAVKCGINKINVDTDIRLAVTRNMKELFRDQPELQKSPSIGAVYELLENNRDKFDPRVFLPPLMDTVMFGNIPDEDTAKIMECVEKGVKEVVGTLIVQFGAYGKAPLVQCRSLDEMKEYYSSNEK